MKTLFMAVTIFLCSNLAEARTTDDCAIPDGEEASSEFVAWRRPNGAKADVITMMTADRKPHNIKQAKDLYKISSKNEKTTFHESTDSDELREYEIERTVTFGTGAAVKALEKKLGYPVSGKKFTQRFSCKFEFVDDVGGEG